MAANGCPDKDVGVAATEDVAAAVMVGAVSAAGAVAAWAHPVSSRLSAAAHKIIRFFKSAPPLC